jgi:hypothetical protein
MGDGFMLIEEIPRDIAFTEDNSKHCDVDVEAGALNSQPQSQPVLGHSSDEPREKHEEEGEDSNPGRYRVRRVAVCLAQLSQFCTYRE